MGAASLVFTGGRWPHGAGGEPLIGGHLVAHSYGALAAMSAQPASLLLVEPACFSLARGRPATEKHIAEVEALLAADVDDRSFGEGFLASVGLTPDRDPSIAGRRVRNLVPPWHVPVVWPSVPTLVVTGGWSALYDEVADSLVELGAERVVLSGAGHRCQDAPGWIDLCEDWARRVSS